jgi:Bacterial regulatory proteins, luxR family
MGWFEQARDRRAPPGRRGPHVRGDRYRAVLFISARTAEHHIQNIYTKIGVSNRAAATRWAVAHRVVDGVPGG